MYRVQALEEQIFREESPIILIVSKETIDLKRDLLVK